MCKDQERSLEPPEDPVKQEQEYNKYEDENWGRTVEEISKELHDALLDIAK